MIITAETPLRDALTAYSNAKERARRLYYAAADSDSLEYTRKAARIADLANRRASAIRRFLGLL